MTKIDALSFSRAGDKYLGTKYSEMDCQEFVEQCMADVGLKMDLGGSNSWYREIMKNGWVGTPEECMQLFGFIPKGAILFIWEPVSASTPEKFRKDGIGDLTHMGIKTGRGDGAIHSSHSKGGVVTSKFKDKTIPNGGWNGVGLYEKFDYGKSVNWILEHRGLGETKAEEKMKKGIVTAPKGKTVNLRKTKDGDLYERIRIGTELLIVAQENDWCKVSVNGMTGWMKTEFILFDGETVETEGEQLQSEIVNGILGDEEAMAEAEAALPFLVRLVGKIREIIGSDQE